MDKDRAIKLVKKYVSFLIEKKYNIKDVYIFGSFAKDNYTKDSDIDLALVFENSKNSFDLDIELMKLTRDFDYIIEPHSFDVKDFNINNPIVYEIMKTGTKII